MFIINVSAAKTLDKAASRTRYLADITLIGIRWRVQRFRNDTYIYIYLFILSCRRSGSSNTVVVGALSHRSEGWLPEVCPQVE